MSRLRAGLEQVLGLLLAAIMAALVLDVLWGVFSRYALGYQSTWTEELARFLLVWAALLGSGLALAKREHLGVDVLRLYLHPAAQPWADVIAHTCTAGFALVMLIGGAGLCWQSWQLDQTLISLPWNWATLYAALPVSGAIMLLMSLEHLAAACRARQQEGAV